MADISERLSKILELLSHMSEKSSERKSLLSALKSQIDRLAISTDAHSVIIGSTELDSALKTALLTKMCALSRDMKDKIFDGYGPLSTFAAKILMAYALGLISRDFYNSLIRINNIRVKFAHPKTFISFQDPEISKLIDSFPELDLTISDRNERFLKKIAELKIHLEGLSVINDQPDVT